MARATMKMEPKKVLGTLKRRGHACPFGMLLLYILLHPVLLMDCFVRIFNLLKLEEEILARAAETPGWAGSEPGLY